MSCYCWDCFAIEAIVVVVGNMSAVVVEAFVNMLRVKLAGFTVAIGKARIVLFNVEASFRNNKLVGLVGEVELIKIKVWD